MKVPFYAASLISVLIAMPAIAQLGPAGVPGVPELFAPSTPTKAQPTGRVAAHCAKAKDVEQCNARWETRQNALAACKDRRGAERRLCLQNQSHPLDCSKVREPARCEQHEKARALCKDTLNKEQHRQCLRDNLGPK